MVINSSQVAKTFDLFIQTPSGAVTLNDERHIILKQETLQPFLHKQFSFQVYFPEEGEYTLYPAQVSVNNVIETCGQSKIIQVLSEFVSPSQEKTLETVQNASNSEVLAFIKASHLTKSTPWHVIAAKFQDVKFYTDVIAIAKKKFYYHDDIWIWSLFHSDVSNVTQFLLQNNNFTKWIGWISNEHITYDPIKNGTFTHLEFGKFSSSLISVSIKILMYMFNLLQIH